MQISFPSIPVLPTYAAQVESTYNAAENAKKQFLVAHAAETAATVHPAYRLNRAEQTQRAKQAEKVELQTMFPIGTAVLELRTRSTQKTLNVVVKFTKAGFPVLNCGTILKFKTWENANGIKIVARTKSQSYAYDNRTFMAIQWPTV